MGLKLSARSCVRAERKSLDENAVARLMVNCQNDIAIGSIYCPRLFSVAGS